MLALLKGEMVVMVLSERLVCWFPTVRMNFQKNTSPLVSFGVALVWSIVFDNYQMDLQIGGATQKFELWDTAGNWNLRWIMARAGGIRAASAFIVSWHRHLYYLLFYSRVVHFVRFLRVDVLHLRMLTKWAVLCALHHLLVVYGTDQLLERQESTCPCNASG